MIIIQCRRYRRIYILSNRIPLMHSFALYAHVHFLSCWPFAAFPFSCTLYFFPCIFNFSGWSWRWCDASVCVCVLNERGTFINAHILIESPHYSLFIQNISKYLNKLGYFIMALVVVNANHMTLFSLILKFNLIDSSRSLNTKN